MLPRNVFSFFLSSVPTGNDTSSALVLGGVDQKYYTGNLSAPIPFDPLQVSAARGNARVCMHHSSAACAVTAATCDDSFPSSPAAPARLLGDHDRRHARQRPDRDGRQRLHRRRGHGHIRHLRPAQVHGSRCVPPIVLRPRCAVMRTRALLGVNAVLVMVCLAWMGSAVIAQTNVSADCSNIASLPDISFLINGVTYTLTARQYVIQLADNSCELG